MAVVSLPDRLWATVIQLGCLQRNSINVWVLLRNFQLQTQNSRLKSAMTYYVITRFCYFPYCEYKNAIHCKEI